VDAAVGGGTAKTKNAGVSTSVRLFFFMCLFFSYLGAGSATSAQPHSSKNYASWLHPKAYQYLTTNVGVQ